MRKFTQDEVEKALEEKGFRLLSEYKDMFSTIIVEEIETGYKNSTTYKCFRNNSKPFTFSKHNIFQQYNMQLYINTIDENVKILNVRNEKKGGKYRNILKLQCKCGNVFERTWGHIFNENHRYENYLCCPQCSQKKHDILQRKKHSPRNKEKIEKYGYTLINQDELINSRRVEVIQNSTGYRVFVEACRINKITKPIVFSEYSNHKNLLYNTQQYIKNNHLTCKAIELTDNKTMLNKTVIKFQCGCGEYFYTDIYHFTGGKIMCEKCSHRISANEEKVRCFLKQQKIKYRREYRFNDCCDIMPLPFDFHLTDYDMLIEVDGLQHDEPCKMYGGMTDEEALQNFIYTQKHDKIKNEYCKKKKIPLLRIKEKDIKGSDNFKSLILNFIKTAKD